MYQQITLDNGVRIVYEKMTHVRSAAVGIWVGVGSRHETKEENGAAHFIEHMLFKGTDKNTAAQLAEKMDAIGGQTNAFTTRESTCFYARVLDSHLDTAIDLLGDMFFNSKLSQEDIDNERGIILEEIDMYDDTPDDLVEERLFEEVFKGSLGRPILGKVETLESMTTESLREFKNSRYVAPGIVVALCGSFEDKHLIQIKELFSAMAKIEKPKFQSGEYSKTLTIKKKETEQNHLCLAFPGLAAGNEKRFAKQLMINILGGGMSSRLFQTVREKYGLCYSIYAISSGFTDTGLVGVSTAVNQDTEMKTLELIMDEISKFLDSGVTDEELYRSREQIKSNLVMTMESTSSRMNKIGSGVLFLDKSMDVNELIACYDAVSREDILQLGRELFVKDQMSLSAVGRTAEADEYRSILKI